MSASGSHGSLGKFGSTRPVPFRYKGAMGTRDLSLVCLGVLLLSGALWSQAHQHQAVGLPVYLGPQVAGATEESVDVALNRNGDGIVVFRRRLQAPPNTQYEILLRRISRGQPATQNELVANAADFITGSAELLHVRAAVDDYGNFAVVWYDTNPSTGWFRILARRGHRNSSLLGAVLEVTPPQDLVHHILPDVALNRSPSLQADQMHLVWQQGVALGASTIRARSYTLLSSDPSVPEMPSPILSVPDLPTPAQGGQERPAIAADQRGGVYYTWRKFDNFGAASPLWRAMLRKRTDGQWNGILDPQHPQAVNGLVTTDYAFSPLTTPLLNSLPEAAPSIAVDVEGFGAVAFRKTDLAPFGVRGFTQGAGNTLIPRPGTLTWVPAPWAAGFGSHDLKVMPGGTAALLWEGTATLQGGPGSANLSFLDLEQMVLLGESTFEATAGETITSLSLGMSDHGDSLLGLSRGPWPTIRNAALRRGTLPRLLVDATFGAQGLSLDVPGLGQFPYRVWPMLAAGPQGAVPLPDGRVADLNTNDPLLSWHLSLTNPNPFLPTSHGMLDSNGRAFLPLTTGASLQGLSIAFSVLILDGTLPFPRELRLFTQPVQLLLP